MTIISIMIMIMQVPHKENDCKEIKRQECKEITKQECQTAPKQVIKSNVTATPSPIVTFFPGLPHCDRASAKGSLCSCHQERMQRGDLMIIMITVMRMMRMILKMIMTAESQRILTTIQLYYMHMANH